MVDFAPPRPSMLLAKLRLLVNYDCEQVRAQVAEATNGTYNYFTRHS